MTPERSEAGYALLEAMVALGIFAVVTGMFFSTIQSSLLVRRHATQLREATLIAQSHLAMVQDFEGLAPSGRDGDFLWQASFARYPGAPNGPGLDRVTVTVKDAESGKPVIALETLRLAK